MRDIVVRRASILLLICPSLLLAEEASKLSPAVREYVRVDAPVVALTHVRVIDGTGAPALEDQTVVIERGKIKAMGGAEKTPAPAGAQILDLPGYTVIPGLVGMHDHLFYPSGGGTAIYNEMGFSAPRLYLASGVTTIRTTGSIEPYTDLELKKLIDGGKMVGPRTHVTGPYLEGAGAFTPQLYELTGPEEARRMVDYWAEEGVTSFKAYMHITRAELGAAIEAAHKRGLKITGHLCAVGFREAAQLGIDDLEHGLEVDTEFVPGKAPDTCPSTQQTYAALAQLDLEGPPVKEMVRDLVRHHVAITSTLAVLETFVQNRPPLEQRVLDALLPQARVDYLAGRIRINERAMGQQSGAVFTAELFEKEMKFERDFVKAGGLLLAGEDPTGYGGVLPGFGDQRQVELLVEAGFTPLEAIHIASANGAEWLGESERIGTVAPGKQADLVVVHGDPSTRIADIEKVEIVFKDGVGFDSAKLVDSVRGAVGLH